jgi:hypothetical protein
MALPIRLKPQLNHATIMENRDITIMACHGFSVLGRLESPLSNLFTGGEQARIYPVIIIRHICMPKASSDHTPEGPPQ